MTNGLLMQCLASKYKHLGIRDIDAIVRIILLSKGDHLAKDVPVEMIGFGSFHNHITLPKTGRNPQDWRTDKNRLSGDRILSRAGTSDTG
jgi:nucleoid DNA-binding protein